MNIGLIRLKTKLLYKVLIRTIDSVTMLQETLVITMAINVNVTNSNERTNITIIWFLQMNERLLYPECFTFPFVIERIELFAVFSRYVKSILFSHQCGIFLYYDLHSDPTS